MLDLFQPGAPWSDLTLIPLLAGYAETHYRFRFFPFSLYHRRRPEVIFDAPHRLEPDAPLPVTLIIKDADRFPVRLLSVRVAVRGGDAPPLSFEFSLDEAVTAPLWHRIFQLDLSQLAPGVLRIETEAFIRAGRRRLVIRNDNHPSLSHAPLTVRKSADPLPGIPGWYAGELHCHTGFGGDQVEFGAPLEAIKTSAAAMGLVWVALTDHSYNLDDYEDDFLRDDPALAKWRRYQETVSRCNSAGGTVLIPGEEVTCRSAAGRNVHLLVLNHPDFLPGSGDSAQRWLRTRSELSVAEALERLGTGAAAVAAHPLEPVPLLERLLVRRGNWTLDDLARERLDGWQLLNDLPTGDLGKLLAIWVGALLRGERRSLWGGDDAHGNFNRFRQVALPMVRLREHHRHLFGRVTTRLKVDGSPTPERLTAALRVGRGVVSTGPMLELTAASDGDIFNCGDAIPGGGEVGVTLRAVSSAEFGPVASLELMTAGDGGERCVEPIKPGSKGFNDPYRAEATLNLHPKRYIRARLNCRRADGQCSVAVTNPVWIN